jgi:hypothetical protein
MEHPLACGLAMAAAGIAGNWIIVRGLPHWPEWMLVPGAILGILSMLLMMIGLGVVVVQALEPVIGLMDLNWDAEPLSAMGIPFALQRKCEQLGYWTAEDLARGVEHGSFPWTKVAYDERMQIERAAHLWKAGVTVRRNDRRRRSKRPAVSWLSRSRSDDG